MLPDYLAGLLNESDREAVLAHSADCPDCIREIESLQLLFRNRKSASEREVIDFSNFIVHVNNKIDARTQSATRRFLIPALAVPAIAAILILVLLNPFAPSETWVGEQDIVLLEELVDQISTSQLIEFEHETVLTEEISLEDAGATTVTENMLDDIDTELSDVLLEDLTLSEFLTTNGNYLSSNELLELLSDEDNDALLAVLSETDFSID